MEYSVKKLAQEYCENLSKKDFDVNIPIAHECEISSYNEYNYQKLIRQFDTLYQHTDSFRLTEQFLKGD